GHDSYPRAIRTELGSRVRHRTSRYLTNRLEQDHRGIKGLYRPMHGFKCPRSAARFCRGHDELRNFLRPRSHHNQHVPADHQNAPPPSDGHRVGGLGSGLSRHTVRVATKLYLLARDLTEPRRAARDTPHSRPPRPCVAAYTRARSCRPDPLARTLTEPF
ncbi:MAG: DDE-type integrase/transposase/recombinase, partial [Acetobacteraceae bacterium]|nr:DDE-type integrase/transposase/recombinase [Acetobacteraceae bacterium]